MMKGLKTRVKGEPAIIKEDTLDLDNEGKSHHNKNFTSPTFE